MPPLPQVGHSLDNDLRALRMTHPWVIDTSFLFPHPRGAPFRHSLRHLAKAYLNRTIQAGEHCAREDADATVGLALLKVQQGKEFGMPRVLDPTSSAFLHRPTALLTELQADDSKYV